MEVLQNSLTGRLLLPVWQLLFHCYNYSGLAILCRGLANWWKGLWHRSVLVAFLSRDGVLSRAWKYSLSCGLLTLLLNLPAALLYGLYRRFRPVFDHSVAARLAFAMGDQTPSAVGWLMLGILIIPYEHWSNSYSLMGFALVFLLMLAGSMHRRTLRLDMVSVGPYTVLFAAAVFLAWPLSYSSMLSFRFLFFHLTCMLCVAITVSTVDRVEDLVRLCAFASAALFLTSAYGVFQRFQGVAVNASYVDLSLNEGMPGRVYSMFENPNAFAEVLVLLIPLAVALALCSRGWTGRFVGALSALVGLAAILMTYSRASWIGLAVAAVVFLFLWKKKILPAFLLLGLVALPFLPDTIFNRILTIFNLNDSSTSSRFPLYEAALRLINRRPVVGAGLGTDVVRKAVADMNLYYGTSPFVHAHNVYLQTWLETGLLGIVAFVASMGWTVKGAVRAATRPECPRPVRLITAAGGAALVGILVCGLADYIWTYPRVMLVFWFLVAVTLAGIRLARKSGRAL